MLKSNMIFSLFFTNNLKKMESNVLYYGIDVSKASLQIAQLSSDGTWHENSISNEIIAIDAWLSSLSLTKSWFVFEYTGSYSQRLAYCLNLKEATFSIITPHQSKGFSQTLKKTSKTDKQDAR